MKISKKISGIDEALEKITLWKKKDKKIVFTNGCFDIVHLGHIDYLEKAKSLGHKLIVGLNSDLSIQKIKGENRPINDEKSRSHILAAFGFVDSVIIFSEPTPLELIQRIKPDILVKGKDYAIGNIVGADFVIKNGGKVATLDLVVGYSTTNIVNKIKKN